MLLFDVTKTGKQGHRSGLTRVSERLRTEMAGSQLRCVSWDELQKQSPSSEDCFFSAELFSETERPGFWHFLKNRACRCEAIFHDAIPLKRPDITWPQSIARHPEYLKLLASFDRIWAVSRASRDELLGFWRWQGLTATPPVEVLALGADAVPGEPRNGIQEDVAAAQPLAFLCLGILEPRKNQELLLDVSCALWDEGASFELHLAGRTNPHFGKPIRKRITSLRSRYSQLHYHDAPPDSKLSELYTRCCATLFPTQAEGCGLPLLESLWRGLPCVCSDLPVLRENADAGGCLPVPTGDRDAWKSALSRLVSDAGLRLELSNQARTRPLPQWKDTARTLLTSLLP